MPEQVLKEIQTTMMEMVEMMEKHFVLKDLNSLYLEVQGIKDGIRRRDEIERDKSIRRTFWEEINTFSKLHSVVLIPKYKINESEYSVTQLITFSNGEVIHIYNESTPTTTLF